MPPVTLLSTLLHDLTQLTQGPFRRDHYSHPSDKESQRNEVICPGHKGLSLKTHPVKTVHSPVRQTWT